MAGPIRPRLSLAVTRIAGAVLGVAGALKLGGEESQNLSGSVLIAAFPVVELLLGGWLLSGACRYGAWLAALLTFSLFGFVAYSQIQAGAADCGCFGPAVQVPPYATLALDVTLVLALSAFRPRWAGWPTVGPGLSVALRTVAVAGLVMATGAAYSYWRYGSVQAGVASAAGLPVAVTTPVVDVGRVTAGELTDGAVEVINLTGSEEQVAYISMRCRCAEFDDLPVALPPGRATRIGFRLRVPAGSGAFRRAVVVQSSAGAARFEIVGVAVASR